MTGVFTCLPKCSPGYQYRTTIDLGERIAIQEGREVVRQMALDYMGMDYDLLRKNCVTFSHDACLRLGIPDREIPEWFRNLCVAGAAAQDASLEVTQVFSSCDMNMDGWADMVQGTATGFEVIGGSDTTSKPSEE